MNALNKIINKADLNELSSLEYCVWYTNNGVGMNDVVSTDAAAELETLRAIQKSAWEFVNADGRHDSQDKYQTLKELVNEAAK